MQYVQCISEQSKTFLSHGFFFLFNVKSRVIFFLVGCAKFAELQRYVWSTISLLPALTTRNAEAFVPQIRSVEDISPDNDAVPDISAFGVVATKCACSSLFEKRSSS